MFNARLRKQLRKAEKSGLRFEIGHLELVDRFYEVFARNMRDLGTPVYARKAFPDSTRIFAVYHQTKIIAMGIDSSFRKTLEIPWASSINDYKIPCPNNMLYWEAIEFDIRNGFNKFDFGRSTPNERTYNFKRQWVHSLSSSIGNT